MKCHCHPSTQEPPKVIPMKVQEGAKMWLSSHHIARALTGDPSIFSSSIKNHRRPLDKLTKHTLPGFRPYAQTWQVYFLMVRKWTTKLCFHFWMVACEWSNKTSHPFVSISPTLTRKTCTKKLENKVVSAMECIPIHEESKIRKTTMLPLSISS